MKPRRRGNNAFLHGRASGIEGIIDAVFLLLHLGLGYRPHIYNGNAPRQF